MIYFYWTTKNAEHIAEHGVTMGEAENVVLNPSRGYPLVQADGKLLVRGQTSEGRYGTGDRCDFRGACQALDRC